MANGVSLGTIGLSDQGVSRRPSRPALLVHVVRSSERDSALRDVTDYLRQAYGKRVQEECFSETVPFGLLNQSVQRACRKLKPGEKVELDPYLLKINGSTKEAWECLLREGLTRA